MKIYHNPRCSKSRQTLQLLREAGIEPTIVEYLKTPLEKDALKKAVSNATDICMINGPRLEN